MPPPLIYLLPLLLGLMLDRRRRLSILPRGAARGLGWARLGGGVALNGWFLRTIREADVPIRTDKEGGREHPAGAQGTRLSAARVRLRAGHPVGAFGYARGRRRRGRVTRRGQPRSYR